MVVCYTLLHYLVVLLGYSPSISVKQSGHHLSWYPACVSAGSSWWGSCCCWWCPAPSCSGRCAGTWRARPASRRPMSRSEIQPVMVAVGNTKYCNVYLGTLNTVQPVEKFIRPERVSVSWRVEVEYTVDTGQYNWEWRMEWSEVIEYLSLTFTWSVLSGLQCFHWSVMQLFHQFLNLPINNIYRIVWILFSLLNVVTFWRKYFWSGLFEK